MRARREGGPAAVRSRGDRRAGGRDLPARRGRGGLRPLHRGRQARQDRADDLAMRAMVLDAPRTPLRAAELPAPEPGGGEVLIEVAVCGVCRTDLHVVDGELTEPKLPLVPGHEIVGRVASAGSGSPRATAWGCRGWAGPTANAATAARHGEPLRQRPFYRLRPRWRVRRGRGGGRAVLLPDPRGLLRPPGRAAALRRADRLPRAAAGGRRRAAGSVRLRRRGPHRVPGRRHEGRRVFAFTREGDDEAQRVRAGAWRGVGRRLLGAGPRSSTPR